MTERQQQVLTFIRQFISKNHYAPTYEEIRVGCHLSSKSLVNYHLNGLERGGHLTRRPASPRCIVLVEHRAA